jgi:hypothetical protein
MRKLIIVFLFFIFYFYAPQANAGFGISPPYVKSDKLIPGSHYEQKIMLLRSSAEEDLTASITINAPEIESWISIDKGENFDLPKGEFQVPMIVKIDVPKDAALDSYKGNLNVRIAPKGEVVGSGVSIALGARIDMDLLVSNQSFPDFILRKIDIYNLEELEFPWNLKIFSYFLYRLKISLKIENVGNIATSPSRVYTEIYDITKTKLLQTGQDESIDKINPFETKEVFAEIPVTVGQGQYWAKIKIYKDNDILYAEEKTFTVFAPGKGEKVLPLGIKPWLLLSGYFLSLLVILFGLFKVKAWRPLIFILYLIITKPFEIIFRKLKKIKNAIKIKFWKWLHEKSAKYQNYDKDKNS